MAVAAALALTAGLFHVFNHSVFKSLLFFGAGSVLNATGERDMHAQTGILRERTLRAADVCFGHRLMIDAIIPGGVARDIAPNGTSAVHALLAEARKVFPRLVELYDNTASLQDRTVTTGIVRGDHARRRANGRYGQARSGSRRRSEARCGHDKSARPPPGSLPAAQ